MFFRLALLLSFFASSASAQIVIQVSPSGPVNGLAAARDEVRKRRAEGLSGPVRIEFAPGVYPVTETIVFTPEDSGTADAPVTYSASPQGGVILTGGRPVTGWQAKEGGVWETKLSDPAWRFEQLWIGGRRGTVARTPNAVDPKRAGAQGGYFNAYSQASPDVFADCKEPAFEAFIARPADFEVLRAVPQAELPDVVLNILQTWTAGQCRVRELNPQAHAVRILGRARYPFVKFEPDQRWFLENYSAALDAPGEWFLNREGVLRCIPLPGEDLATLEVIAPVVEKLLYFKGDAKGGAKVAHLNFEGLVFSHAQALFGTQGHHDGQAAAGVGAAVELDGSAHVHFTRCEFSHTGGYGIWFRDACADSSLTHCLLEDLGGGGVRIGNTQMPDNARLTHHITVEDCILRQGGRRYPSACGVFLAHAADCVVRHCDISDFYYTGISAGWVWGYTPSPSKRNRFDFNHIHHLGWGVLSDMGGFYGLGRAEGTTISNNHIHDVASYRYGGWGLYTDEGSTGVTMENNLVHDTSESTFHQHYGKWNQVSNNIFAFGRKAQIQRTRPEKHASFAYERNIVVYDIPVLLDGTGYNWETGTYEMRNNLYWNSAGLPVKFHDTDLAGWQKRTGHDEGSLVADPLFENLAARDFRLKPDSPALKLGFKPFDSSLAGVRSSDAWRTKARKGDFSRFGELSKPWPQPGMSLDEDFEHMGLSFPTLPRQEIHWQNKGDSIFVADDQAASGRRSLKITDAPGLKPTWDPHLVLKPAYTEGLATVAFDLRTLRTSSFFIEWRGEGQDYVAGPSLWYENGVLKDRKSGRKTTLPPETWTRLEMTCGLGSKANGKWTLKIQVQGQPAIEWKDLACGEGWTEFSWLGFVSTASTSTAFWLDNLVVNKVD